MLTSLTLSINNLSTAKRYLQIQQQIVELIQSKRLLAGDRVPSSRELATQLGVSRTTTVKAYDNLIAEGYLVSEHKRGVFVADEVAHFEHTKQSEPQHSQPKSQVRNSFSSAANVSLFPHKVWANGMRQSWHQLEHQALLNSSGTGYWPLQQQIASYLQALRGLTVEPEQIVVTAGNRDALTILLHTLQGKTPPSVWLENPSYPKIPALLNLLGQEPKPLTIDPQGAVVPADLTGCNLFLLMPNRQYPLGTKMSSSRRQQWLHLLKQKTSGGEHWVIEDDYDSEFIYRGQASVPLMQQDLSASTFLIGSFSKSLFPALRLGYIVSPPDMLACLRSSQAFLGSSASLGLQPALARFMQSGEFSRHLRRMRRTYLQQRDELIQLLTPLSTWLTFAKPNAGLHLVAYLKSPWQHEMRIDRRLAEYLAKEGVTIDPLSKHYFTGAAQQGFLFGFSHFSQQPEKDIQLMQSCFEVILG